MEKEKEKEKEKEIEIENNTNIFVPYTSTTETNSIAKKITYTNILETIPATKTKSRDLEALKKGKIEWRWRFLTFQNKYVTEISYLKGSDEGLRMYFNKSGEWVNRKIDPVYNEYVTEEWFVYAD